MDTKEINSFTNKRKFFRVYPDKPICTKLSIISMSGNLIKTNTCNVCVKDIGIGGLQFLAKLDFPVGKNIVYKFKILILNECHYVEGNIVWKKEEESGNLCYGVNFILNDNDISYYFTVFNNFALIVKRNSLHHGCNFCNIKRCPNKSL